MPFLMRESSDISVDTAEIAPKCTVSSHATWQFAKSDGNDSRIPGSHERKSRSTPDGILPRPNPPI